MTTARVTVRVHPRSRRQELGVLRHGVLAVRVKEPAIDGRANRAVCRLLAKRLGVAPSRVTIAHGQARREKLIVVAGIDQAQLDAALS
jgi:uncharacterized protein YggU (UPF0235/DUF167 family)